MSPKESLFNSRIVRERVAKFKILVCACAFEKVRILNPGFENVAETLTTLKR